MYGCLDFGEFFGDDGVIFEWYFVYGVYVFELWVDDCFCDCLFLYDDFGYYGFRSCGVEEWLVVEFFFFDRGVCLL